MTRFQHSPEQDHILLVLAASFPLTSDTIWYLEMSSESIFLKYKML